MNSYVITFAGVAGSSKTPIANHLSWKLGLPSFSNDALRNELREDTLSYDDEAYKQLHQRRFDEALSLGRSFIFDASVDRTWPQLRERFRAHGYECLIISLDLSRPFVDSLYKAKNYDQFEVLDMWMHQHEQFLKEYSDVVTVHITDGTFKDRLELSFDAVHSRIQS